MASPRYTSLLCSEVSLDEGACQRRKSLFDSVMLCDDRVLENLLQCDDRRQPSPSYFRFQTEVKPYMRTTVTRWMLEVCMEQRCEEATFPLSVSYMDRVLSVLVIKKTQLQLLAATCMFIASKFRNTHPISASNLVIYTDSSITISELLDWEMMVLHTLKWELALVTPHDFIEHILRRLPLPSLEACIEAIRTHTQTFIAICTVEVSFLECPASMVAAACIAAATTGLLGERQCLQVRLLDRLAAIIASDKECLRVCQEQIESVLKSNLSESLLLEKESAEYQQVQQPVQPQTPSDVRKIVVLAGQ